MRSLVVCAVCACFNWLGYEAIDLGAAGWHHPKCPKRPRLERERDAATEEGES